MTEWLQTWWPFLSPLAVGIAWAAFQAVRGYVASKADADPVLDEWDHLKAALGNVKPWGRTKGNDK